MALFTVYTNQDRTDWFVVPVGQDIFIRSYCGDDVFSKDGQVEAADEDEALGLAGYRYCGVEPA